MAQIVINNGDSGLTVRTALNSMFAELYGSIIVPIKVNGVNANRTQAIPANAFVSDISLSATAGAPTFRIGTTPGGNEVLPDTLIGNSLFISVQLYFQGAGNLYFTLTGVGTISYRIDVLNNFY